MRRQILLGVALISPLALAACGAPEGTAAVNGGEVANRIAKTVEEFDAYLRRYDYKDVNSAMFQQFSKTIEHALNEAPAFHDSKIVTQLNKDASITGYGDLNGNGKIDGGEPNLFKMEIDADNSRIIVTTAAGGSATGHAMPRGSGFFAGAMIGALTSRQTAAGVRPGHFNTRSVQGAPVARRPAQKVAQSSAARGSARSGGLRAGK